MMNNASSISLLSFPQPSDGELDTDSESVFELESDISDERHDLDLHERDMPPRPTSRLGFNQSDAEDTPIAPLPKKQTPSHSRSPSNTMKWTRSLFQKIGITALPGLNSISTPTIETGDVDMDITSVSTAPNLDDDIEPALPVLPALSSSFSTSSLSLNEMDTYDGGQGSSCDGDSEDSDSDCSLSSEDSDVDLDSPAEYGRGGRGHLSIPPVSALSPPPTPTLPPDLTTSPRPPSPPPRSKFTCLPSPLSTSAPPVSDVYITPTRHMYENHGHSRHSLLHLKYFWGVRQDEWEDYAAGLNESKAYGGISILAGTAGSPSIRFPSIPRRTVPHHQLKPLQLPPMTVHPRRGDIAALRDPYCVHMDRCFVSLSMWTMGKTLWMFDMHMAVEGRIRAQMLAANCTDAKVLAEEDLEESEGESLAASLSTGFSDDSDMTLVESESESADMAHVNDGKGQNPNADSMTTSSSSYLRLSASSSTSSPGLKFKTRPPYSNPISCESSSRPLWETNWYKRWELLIELVRLDSQHARMRSNSQGLSSTSVSCLSSIDRPKSPRFFILDDEQDMEETWDDVLQVNADDEDEDDVMIVSNPLFAGASPTLRI